MQNDLWASDEQSLMIVIGNLDDESIEVYYKQIYGEGIWLLVYVWYSNKRDSTLEEH